MQTMESNNWNAKGVMLIGQMKFQEALECFDKALEINPAHTWANINKQMTLNFIDKEEKSN